MSFAVNATGACDATVAQGGIVVNVGRRETSPLDKEHLNAEQRHRYCHKYYCNNYDFQCTVAFLLCKYMKGIQNICHI